MLLCFSALEATEDERRLQRLKQELMSIGVLTERVRLLETELAQKDAETRALRAASKQSYVRELSAEAQIYYNEAQRLKKLLDNKIYMYSAVYAQSQQQQQQQQH